MSAVPQSSFSPRQSLRPIRAALSRWREPGGTQPRLLPSSRRSVWALYAVVAIGALVFLVARRVRGRASLPRVPPSSPRPPLAASPAPEPQPAAAAGSPAPGSPAVLPASPAPEAGGHERWPAAAAWAWRRRVGWLVGANFVPSAVGNAVEMWQADTWDAEAVDRELGWAARAGVNSVRVFLHHIPFEADEHGFLSRVDTLLSIAHRHGISAGLVLFDACWRQVARAGPQPAAIPGVHNSVWVQCPAVDVLQNTSQWPRLRRYVREVVRSLRFERRVAFWDVYNEPSQVDLDYNLVSAKLPAKEGGGDPTVLPPATKNELVFDLMTQAFQWVREEKPIQPLTSALWGSQSPETARVGADWSARIAAAQLAMSDVLSFHSYDGPDLVRALLTQMERLKRPVLCTEWLARTDGQSTFAAVLPLLHRHGTSAFMWGLVSGRTQTVYPWSTWLKPADGPPTVWHHDLLHGDGLPYDGNETALILKLRRTAAPRRNSTAALAS